jgi:hypothetical protein
MLLPYGSELARMLLPYGSELAWMLFVKDQEHPSKLGPTMQLTQPRTIAWT